MLLKTQAIAHTDALYDVIDAIGAGTFPWRRIPASFEIDGNVQKCGSRVIYWRHGADNIVRVVAVLHGRMHQVARFRDVLGGEP